MKALVLAALVAASLWTGARPADAADLSYYKPGVFDLATFWERSQNSR